MAAAGTTMKQCGQVVSRIAALGAVAADAEQRGEPRLTSVCVTAERLIGCLLYTSDAADE